MCVVVLALLGATYYMKYHMTYNEYCVTIMEASTVRPADGYRVSAIDALTNEPVNFTNRDDGWFFKFDSADVQTQLRSLENQEVCLAASGVRVRFLSMFPNIIKVVE